MCHPHAATQLSRATPRDRGLSISPTANDKGWATGSSGLLAAPAWTEKRAHSHYFVGRIGLVIVPTSRAVDHKSSTAADRIAHIAAEVTGADHLTMKTKGGNSLPAVISILPKPRWLRHA